MTKPTLEEAPKLREDNRPRRNPNLERLLFLSWLADRFGYEVIGVCDNHGRPMDRAVLRCRAEEPMDVMVPLPANLEIDLDAINALPADPDDETVNRAWSKPFPEIEAWLVPLENEARRKRVIKRRAKKAWREDEEVEDSVDWFTREGDASHERLKAIQSRLLGIRERLEVVK